MPVDTHQVGRVVDPDEILDLLESLLSDQTACASGSTTLARLGVDYVDIDDLWAAVGEEFAGRDLRSHLHPGALNPSRTLGEAAAAMAALLNEPGGHGD